MVPEKFSRFYDPEYHGNLVDYLKEVSDLREIETEEISNLFCGADHFFEIKEKDLIVPGQTTLKVKLSPGPDLSYIVNAESMLEGSNRGKDRGGFVYAKEGTYDPKKTLKDQIWSIYFLSFKKDS